MKFNFLTGYRDKDNLIRTQSVNGVDIAKVHALIDTFASDKTIQLQGMGVNVVPENINPHTGRPIVPAEGAAVAAATAKKKK